MFSNDRCIDAYCKFYALSWIFMYPTFRSSVARYVSYYLFLSTALNPNTATTSAPSFYQLLESLLHNRVDGFVQGRETALLGMVGQWDHSHPAPDIDDDDEEGHPQKMWKHHRYEDANAAAKRALRDDDENDEEVVRDALSGLSGIGSDPSAMTISNSDIPSDAVQFPSGVGPMPSQSGVELAGRPGTPAMGAWSATGASSSHSQAYPQSQVAGGGRGRRAPGVPLPSSGDADPGMLVPRRVRGERRKMVAECKGLRAQVCANE